MPKSQIFTRIWILNAPWAHPVWIQYAISLVDLTTKAEKPVTLHAAGVTHEVAVFAVNPETSLDRLDGDPGKVMLPAGSLLQPMNHGYQFAAADDADAAARIQAIANCIRAKLLSPDTDNSVSWDLLFADGVSLKYAPRTRN